MLFKEDQEFQKDWNKAKLKCELILIDVIHKHLSIRVIGHSQDNLRDMGQTAYKNIRKYALTSEASNLVNNTLHEAKKERKERKELRAKRRLEVNNKKAGPANKKRKPTERQ